MEIITGTEFDLRNMIQETSLQYFRAVDPLEKCTLYCRLDSLCRILTAVNKDNKKVRLGQNMKKEKDQFEGLLNLYGDKLISEFIDDKEFHNTYLGDMLDVESEELTELVGMKKNFDGSRLSKDDFSGILFDFLKTMNLGYILDDLIKKRRIFSKIRPYRPYSLNFNGLVLHNPVDGDMAIVIDDFQYKIGDMAVLVHELGHVYDLLRLENEDLCQNVTNYAYSSVLGEVVSTMFEKRFYEYLIKNNIMTNKAKQLYNASLFEGRNHVFVGYVLSLLDDGYLKDDKYASLQEEELFKLVSEKFDDTASLRAIISYKDFSLHDDLCYGYGEILSLFLKNEVDNEGFDGKLTRDLMECRTEVFDPGFIEKHDLDVKTYKKLYKQDVQLCKK